jgi:hypothetical protein
MYKLLFILRNIKEKLNSKIKILFYLSLKSLYIKLCKAENSLLSLYLSDFSLKKVRKFSKNKRGNVLYLMWVSTQNMKGSKNMEISKTGMNQCAKAVNFSGKKVYDEDQSQIYETKENKSFNTMLGVTALAASAIAAIALRGRSNALKALKETAQKEVATMVDEVSNLKLQNLDIDLFKKIGKFDKGQALVGDKLYSGNIYTKNGYKMIYEDGILRRSETIASKNGEPAKFKLYNSDGKFICSRNNDYGLVDNIKDTYMERLEDGTIIRTQKRGYYDGQLQPQSRDIITTIKPDGTVTKLEQNLETFRFGEQKITYDKTTILNTGEIKLTKKEIKPFWDTAPRDTIRKTKIVDGQKVYERVGKDGKVTSWTNNFNKETGIATQTIKEPDGNIVTVMRDKQGNVLTHNNKLNWYTYHSSTNIDMKKYSTKNPYGILGTSKEEMQKFIKENGLPFVI